MAEKPITTAPYSTGVSGDYYIFVNDNGVLRQVDIDIISKHLGNVTWTTLTGKPFNNVNSNEFTISGETLKINGYHTHNNVEILNNFALNENGALVYDGNIIGGYTLPIATEETLGGIKPDGTTITIDEDGTIHGANTYELPVASDTVLGGVKIDNDTIKSNNGVISADVIGNWSAGTSYPVGYFVVYDNKLYECTSANSDTSWNGEHWQLIGDSSSGTTINNWSASTDYVIGDLVINETTLYQCNTEHTSDETFDETESANWTALSGAKGEKGYDGFSPIAKVVATETGATITITDGTETTTVDIVNGENGITPHIDETTKHWMVGETDTGVLAEGINGISPTATVEQTETGATITIVSGEQTTTAELTNGISTIQTTSTKFTGTLTVEDWIGDTVPYTQTITMENITSDVIADFGIIITKDNIETALEEKRDKSSPEET